MWKERYFLGGLGSFQLRGFKARSVGPRRAILRKQGDAELYIPAGSNLVDLGSGTPEVVCSLPGGCNDIDDKKISDFENLDATDVIGGNKFVSSSIEYRFPISETIGLQGVVFLDMGNSFAEGENLFDIPEWRYGSGGGGLWFSPFGPLAMVLGWPLNPLGIETSPVFEFSVGGGGF